MDNDEQGFALIELLVVVIIIGVLAAIAIPTFLRQKNAGYQATLQADLRNIAVEAETYHAKFGTYDGFEASPAFSVFQTSPTVILAMDAADSQADHYCIQASTNGQTWSIRTDPADAYTSLDESAC